MKKKSLNVKKLSLEKIKISVLETPNKVQGGIGQGTASIFPAGAGVCPSRQPGTCGNVEAPK